MPRDSPVAYHFTHARELQLAQRTHETILYIGIADDVTFPFIFGCVIDNIYYLWLRLVSSAFFAKVARIRSRYGEFTVAVTVVIPYATSLFSCKLIVHFM